jgi:hypothetical protein
MHVLVTIETRGWSAIKTSELLELGLKHSAKSLSQKRIVHQERVLVEMKESANPLMIPPQGLWNRWSSEAFGKINM